jgi:hypothetical protein
MIGYRWLLDSRNKGKKDFELQNSDFGFSFAELPSVGSDLTSVNLSARSSQAGFASLRFGFCMADYGLAN